MIASDGIKEGFIGFMLGAVLASAIGVFVQGAVEDHNYKDDCYDHLCWQDRIDLLIKNNSKLDQQRYEQDSINLLTEIRDELVAK